MIDDATDIANDDENKGAWGMSFEEGVAHALDWVLGNGDKPLGDEE